MNIKTKFIIIASALTVSSLINMAITDNGIGKMDLLADQLQELNELQVAQMNADNMDDAMLSDAKDILAALRTGDAAARETAFGNLRLHTKRLDDSLNGVDDKYFPENIKQEVAKVFADFAEFKKDIQAMTVPGIGVGAASEHLEAAERKYASLEKEQDDYEDLTAKWEGSMSTEQSTVVGQTKMLINSIFCISILISIVVPIFAVRGLFRPLSQMMSAMDKIAKGEAGTSIPHTSRTDEMGDMARTVQVFKETAQQVVKNAEDRKIEHEQSQVEKRKSMNALADSFEANVKGVVDMVASAATEMDATSQSVTHIAQTNQNKLKALTVQIEGTTRNVQTVASATSQMSEAVQEINQQVNRASSITHSAVEEAKKADQTVAGLSDAANKIGEVVEMINSIAAQINLLALNATIEAARAGDAGKGFAVVASEVKSLATQTTKATEQIGQYINSIQEATGNTVGVIKNIGDTIREINEISTTIAAAVEEQGVVTKDIANNVNQAAAGTEEVARSTADVAAASRETGEAAGQMTEASSELSRQSEVLRGEVDKFLSGIRNG